eukprot:TRINITY_DN110_c0_g1_i1.p1 TRINITY_DN110_c0_g1~~TRINITY_DN110_c0_g1_i1.p1  ORF type:complete len:441 (+),score=80.98 TRINITY_DN110_c0_g1_i1:66-1325(+)
MPAVAALLSLCFSAGDPQWLADFAGDIAYRVAVSPDEKLAAVASSVTFQVNNIATGDPVTVPTYFETTDIAFSPDSDKVAVAMGGRGLAVVELSSGTQLWSDSSSAGCRFVAYAPDGKTFASSYMDGTIAVWKKIDPLDFVAPLDGVWSIHRGYMVVSLVGGHTEVAAIVYTIDGGRIISGSEGNPKVVVWNATSGAILKTLTDHTRPIYSVFVSPDGLYFASVGLDAVNIYKLSDYSLHKTIPKAAVSPQGTSFSHDWSKFVMVGRVVQGSPVMEMYSVETGGQVGSYMPTETFAVSYFHTTDAIVTASGLKMLLWDYVPAPPTPSPPPTPAPAIHCDIVTVTQATECKSGYSLISPDVATRCKDTLCDLLKLYRGYWAHAFMDNTDKLFAGPGHVTGCGVVDKNGVTGSGVLCAPGV